MRKDLVQKFYFSGLIAFSLSLPLLNISAYQLFSEITGDIKTVQHSLAKSSIRKIKYNNNYLLYTRKNPTLPQKLVFGDEISIKSSNFDPQVPTMIYAPGWLSEPNNELGILLRKVLLYRENVNVIIVDWRAVSMTLNYFSAVIGVRYVGRILGLFLEHLNNVTGAPFSSMHLIGHSLGSYVVANAGKHLNGQIARITALDPAGPAWYLNPYRLKPFDAIYVEAIHTDSDILGIYSNLAQVDFYPNGGSIQPGCMFPLCNHDRAIVLFIYSIAFPDRLVGKKCANAVEMESDTCNGSKLPLGNTDLRKTGRGVYRLNTNTTYPYLTKILGY